MSNDPNLVYAAAPLDACNAPLLVSELEALGISGVRTYTVVGAGSTCLGVYPWSSAAAADQYEHVQVAEADAQTIRDAIAAHPATAALASIRAHRDALLATCDWTQLADSPLDGTTKAAWATYRQQLRDYPDQPGFDPLSPPAWPTAPA